MTCVHSFSFGDFSFTSILAQEWCASSDRLTFRPAAIARNFALLSVTQFRPSSVCALVRRTRCPLSIVFVSSIKGVEGRGTSKTDRLCGHGLSRGQIYLRACVSACHSSPSTPLKRGLHNKSVKLCPTSRVH